MSTDRDDVLKKVKDLREAAEEAGLVESDPWASLDAVWKGPDVDLEKISVLGEEAIAAIHEAHAEGRADQSIVKQALELAKLLLPAALTQL